MAIEMSLSAIRFPVRYLAPSLAATALVAKKDPTEAVQISAMPT